MTKVIVGKMVHKIIFAAFYFLLFFLTLRITAYKREWCKIVRVGSKYLNGQIRVLTMYRFEVVSK